MENSANPKTPTASCQLSQGPRRCEFLQLCTWRRFDGFSPQKLRKIPILTHIFQMGYIHKPVFQRICWYMIFVAVTLGGMDFWTNSIGFRPEPLFGGWVSHHFERPTSRVVETDWLDGCCWEFPKMCWSWLVGLALNTHSCYFYHCKLEEWCNNGLLWHSCIALIASDPCFFALGLTWMIEEPVTWQLDTANIC